MSYPFLVLSESVWDAALPAGTDALWLYGPTASGKSALAMSIAARRKTVIINADASQLYADLAILTARPGAAEEAAVPHALYGVLPGTTRASAGLWLQRVESAIRAAQASGAMPLLVGGTGLYLHSLLDGIAPIPPVPAALETALEEERHAKGLGVLHVELATADPALAARLMPGDTQRILRALAVLRATGRSLSYWHGLPRQRILPEIRWFGLCLMPPRETLYPRIDARAAEMLAQGAVAEVEALRGRGYAAEAPIMKAIGVREILGWLEGTHDRGTALAQLQQHSRNYAKRQLTWGRTQLR